MRTNVQALMAGLEDNGEGIVEEHIGSDSMESEMLDVEEARQGAESAADDVAELEEAAEGLEAIAASLEAAVADGGIDENAAKFLGLGVESYTSRLGLDAAQIVPSLESFGGASGQASATTISLEGIQDTIKKVWAAIKQAVAKAIQAVQDFFAKIFQSVDKVIDRAKALQKQVSDLGDKKAEGEVAVPNNLSIGGKNDAASIKKGLDNLKTVGNTLNRDYIGKAASFYATVGKKNSDSSVMSADSKEAVESAIEEQQSAMKSAVEVTVKNSSLELPGGYHFVTTSKGDSEGNGESSLPTLQKKGGDSGEAKIDALSASDMKAILTDVQGLAEMIKGKKDAMKKLQDARKDAVSKAQKLVDAGEKGKLGKGWEMAKTRVSLGMVNKDLARPVTQYCSHTFNVARAALSLVEKSVKAYK